MSLDIRTNVSSITAQRNLFQTQNDLSMAVSHLSSGYRINTAADDAAGLGISENLRGQVRGDNQAVRNAQDGISLIQTADGGMTQQTSILQRMRELAVQAANDTLTSKDRSNINKELVALRAEFNAITDRTKFNGQSVLGGAFAASFDSVNSGLLVGEAAGAAAGDAVVANIDTSGAKGGTTYNITQANGVLTLTNATTNQAQNITLSDVAANTSTLINFDQLGVKLTVVANAATTGANMATAIAGSGADVRTSAGGSSLDLQLGANASDKVTVSSFSKVYLAAGTDAGGSFDTLFNELTTFNTNSVLATPTTSAQDARDVLDAVDNALSKLNGIRADLGAVQNRLVQATANLQTSSENLAASDARIRNVNVAEETSKMTSAQVLMQAGISVLAQANQQPQLALKLLG